MNLKLTIRNIEHYAKIAENRLNDGDKGLSEKSKYNIRSQAETIAKAIIELKIGIPSKMTAEEFKELINHWQNEGYKIGTLQNMATVMRHLLTAANNSEIAKISNGYLGISSGRDVLNKENVDKSARLSPDEIAKIAEKKPDVAAAVILAQSYGLRKKEAVSIVKEIALKHNSFINGNKIELKKSHGTKNGRPRSFVMADGGKALLKAVELAKNFKVSDFSLKQRMDRLANSMKSLGVNFHGFRHSYAQNRYKDLTGMTAPVAGGLKFQDMNDDQKKAYNEALGRIANELGHNRSEISQVYIGK